MMSLHGCLLSLPAMTETAEGKENQSWFGKVASPVVYLQDSNRKRVEGDEKVTCKG